LTALCAQGQALHQAGKMAGARAVYLQVLQKDPRHFEALRLLGVLSLQTGAPDQAVALLRRAIDADPNVAHVHATLGSVFVSLDRSTEALASYDRALTLDPKHANTHYNRAVVLQGLGRLDEALKGYDRVITLTPRHASSYYNRAAVLRALGRAAEAVASYDRAIAIEPSAPDHHYNRGLALGDLARHAEALASYDRAIALKPDYAAAHNNRGTTLVALGRHQEALASFDRAVALNPRFAEAHNNRASALFRLGRLEDGLASCDQAIALQPALAEAHANRGSLLSGLARPGEALASFDAAIALNPDAADAHVNRGFTLLLTGRFAEGWREHEWRKRQRPQDNAFHRGAPWSGDEPLEGRRLFVYAEQGLGDTIQFSRYLPLLEARGAAVTLAAQRPLASLLRQLSPSLKVLGPGERAPSFDYHCSLMSLPLAFGTTLESIPAGPAYLRADPDRRARFAERLGTADRPRVGLVWSGSPTHDNDLNRSIAFDQISPLLTADAEWISLHQEIRPTDLEAVHAGGRVAFLGDQLKDFSDTAALLDLMDLVITVDTSVAHLAGAMGKPVWILLPFAPDWRWLLDRDDSPWHPSARLFRQRRRSDWPQVIAEIRRELSNVLT
jgi:tetratricopeptide (TPR) repeat protein